MQAQDDANANPEPKFHPIYNDAETTDLVLASSDNVRFRVHSVVLTTASGVFRQMMGVERDSKESSETPVQMDESAEVLQALLDVFYPDRLCLPPALACRLPSGPGGGNKAWRQEQLPPSPPFHILRDLALAADKYDMPGVMRVVRRSLFIPLPQANGPTNNNGNINNANANNVNNMIPINPNNINNPNSTPHHWQVLVANPFQHPPVELYALARRLEWEAEAHAASTATLACTPLIGPGSQGSVRRALETMDAASAIRLLDLHTHRRAAFAAALDVVKARDAEVININGVVDYSGSPSGAAVFVQRCWADVRNMHKGCKWNMYKDKTASLSRSLADRDRSVSSTSSSNASAQGQQHPPPLADAGGAAGVGNAPPTPTTPTTRVIKKDALPSREHLQAWHTFTQCALAELDRSLVGKTLRSDAFWQKEAFGNLWLLSCPNVNCSIQLVSRAMLKTALLRDLDALPNSI